MDNIRIQGFSLVEVLISLSLLAMLTTLALPSIKSLIDKTTINRVRQSLISDIRLMRSHSISRRLPAYLCALDHEDKCDSNINWSIGWMGYIDANDNHHFDENEAVLVRHKNTHLASINIYTHTVNKNIKINGLGVIVSRGNIRICDPNIRGGQTMTLIRMNSMGRLAIETDEKECA